jgi:uncharacterized protein
MGHRDSSPAISRRSSIRTARGGPGEVAAEPPVLGAGPLSLPARLLVAAIRVYQAFFSGLMPSACKFYPSCSHYAADAVRLHGARHGFWLALRRLARCHPFSRGGVDPVPDPVDSKSGNSGATAASRAGREVRP